MGKLMIGNPTVQIAVDDRTLAHLQSVMIAKLRREEKFTFTWTSPLGEFPASIIWMHPAVALQFHFETAEPQPLNAIWIDVLAMSAAGSSGLRIIDEPQAAPPSRAAPTLTPGVRSFRPPGLRVAKT